MKTFPIVLQSSHDRGKWFIAEVVFLPIRPATVRTLDGLVMRVLQIPKSSIQWSRLFDEAAAIIGGQFPRILLLYSRSDSAYLSRPCQRIDRFKRSCSIFIVTAACCLCIHSWKAIPAMYIFASFTRFRRLGMMLMSKIWSLGTTVLSMRLAKPLPEYSLSSLKWCVLIKATLY